MQPARWPDLGGLSAEGDCRVPYKALPLRHTTTSMSCSVPYLTCSSPAHTLQVKPVECMAQNMHNPVVACSKSALLATAMAVANCGPQTAAYVPDPLNLSIESIKAGCMAAWPQSAGWQGSARGAGRKAGQWAGLSSHYSVLSALLLQLLQAAQIRSVLPGMPARVLVIYRALEVESAGEVD
jgi:hypothetical protein